MGRQEKIEIRTINDDKRRSQANYGPRIIAKEIVNKYGLSVDVVNPIIFCIEKDSKAKEYIGDMIRVIIRCTTGKKKDIDYTNRTIICFLNNNICLRPEELKRKIIEWQNKGVGTKELFKSPAVLRNDVSDETLNILSIILRKANIEPTPKEISKYMSLGVTLDPKLLIKKFGICLAVGATASDILKNYKLITDQVPVEMLYAAVFESAVKSDVRAQHIPGSLPPKDVKVDLRGVYEVIKLEEEKIKAIGKINEAKNGIMSRYVYGRKADFCATYRATTYLEIDKRK